MTTLELELVELKARLARLEATVRRLAGDEQEVAMPSLGNPLDQRHLLEWLKAEGLVRDPTSEERRLAAEWDALPEGEKQTIRHELDHLPPGPMVSDIVIENRR